MPTPYFNPGHGQPVIVQGQTVQPQPFQKQHQPVNPLDNAYGGFANLYGGGGVQKQPASSSFRKNDTTTTLEYGKPATSFALLQQQSNEKLPPQERRCHDAFWAILFYAHLGAIAFCTIVYAPKLLADFDENLNSGEDRRSRLLLHQVEPGGLPVVGRFLEQDDDTELDIDPAALLVLVCLSTALSLVVSTLALGFMMAFAEALVKISLFFNIALCAIMALLSLAVGALPMSIMFVMMTGFMGYYTCRVWSRIPFAAANLVTAVTAVRANLGLAIYSYFAVLLVFGWSLWWSIASLSAVYVSNGCAANGNCQSEVTGGIVFLFLLSYYWTIQVISNVVHCSTAGTVGTWWYAPSEANGCCSNAVRDSYVRSLTYSFGSICFASLVVAIIQAIREMVHSLRDNGDSFIACCAECLLACIESLVELFNRFALVYCAVHGQSFLNAGRSVMDLFRARGWTTIITDYMVDTVLSMMSIGVGLMVGLLAVVIGTAMRASGQTLGVAFLIGLIVGYAVCATLLSVVSSAVNTVIVCYAEAPNEFQANHPELSQNMRAAWRQAWPNEFSY